MPKKPDGASPIELQWGTFCKQVLEEHGTNERSLIGLIPGLNMVLQLHVPGQGVLECPLPPISLHGVFKRRVQDESVIEVMVDFVFEFPGYGREVLGKGSAPLKFGVLDQAGQLSVKINNPRVKVAAEPGIYREQLTATFSVSGEQIGQLVLPMRVEVIGAKDGRK